MCSTAHGDDFGEAVFEVVQALSQREGDVASRVGKTTGYVKRSKVGDIVVDVSPDSRAAGQRVVIEAKSEHGVTLKNALAELEVAKKNRGAAIGMFVYSTESPPPDVAPCKRYGTNLVVVWHPADAATTLHVECGLSLAKWLLVQADVARGKPSIHGATVSTATSVNVPKAGSDRRTELEVTLKALGHWDQVDQLSSSELKKLRIRTPGRMNSGTQ